MCRVKRHKDGMQQESALHSVKSRLQLWELVLKYSFSFFSPLVIDLDWLVIDLSLTWTFVITISHSAQRIKKMKNMKFVAKGNLWPHSGCTHCFLAHVWDKQCCASFTTFRRQPQRNFATSFRQCRTKLDCLQNFTFGILVAASSKAHKNRRCYTKTLSPPNKRRH